MENSTKTVIVIGGVIIVGLIVFLAASGILSGSPANTNISGKVTDTTNSEVQNVVLRVSGGNYILEPSVLKKGVKVRMQADMNTVVGCSQDIVISAFGVRKYVSSGDNIIEFTPDKTGTINIACSMNMYRGTFTVVD